MQYKRQHLRQLRRQSRSRGRLAHRSSSFSFHANAVVARDYQNRSALSLHGEHCVSVGVTLNVGVSLGAAAGGIAAGAAAGTVAVGPVGTVVGAAVGALAGGLGGKAVAEHFDPTVEETAPEHDLRTTTYRLVE